MITAEDFVLELNDKEENKNFKLGMVVDLFENETAKIQFDGEDTPSEKQYAYLESYAPKVFDRILLGVLGGTYVILGKVNYNVSPSTKEELDRYLFDLKLVTMQKGLSITGATTLNSGATVIGNIGVNGNVNAVGISATGNINAANISTPGTLGAGVATLASLTVQGSLVASSTLSVSSTLTASNTFSHRGSQLGFYNTSPTNKKNVGRYVSGSPTVAGLYGKLDELIVALQNYGLIN